MVRWNQGLLVFWRAVVADIAGDRIAPGLFGKGDGMKGFVIWAASGGVLGLLAGLLAGLILGVMGGFFVGEKLVCLEMEERIEKATLGILSSQIADVVLPPACR